MSFKIELLPAFADNYIFLLSDRDLGLAMVVDPGDGDVVLRALKERDLYRIMIPLPAITARGVVGFVALVALCV